MAQDLTKIDRRNAMPTGIRALLASMKSAHIADASTASGAGSATARLNTGVIADNNSIAITSILKGTLGNDITIAFTDPGSAGQSITITRVNKAISIALGTAAEGEGGAVNSTATDVISAINASEVANDLIFAANNGASTGEGIVAAFVATPLAGGADAATVTGAEFNALVSKVNSVIAALENAGITASS